MPLRHVARLHATTPAILIATASIRPDHWLLVQQAAGSDGELYLVLYVADEDLAEAMTLCPSVPVGEIDNNSARIRKLCVS